MDLSDLKKKRAPIEFQFDGEWVKGEYYPHKLTPTYQAEIRRIARDEGDDQDGDAKVVSELLASWDVTADGQPFPPTYANLLTAPRSLVTRVALEILSEVGKLATPEESKQ